MPLERRQTTGGPDVPELEVLASLQCQLRPGLALDAFQSQHNLLRGLGLLVEDGLGLTTVTGLLAVVSALSLGKQRGFAGLVLSHLVLGVLAALLALAVGVAGFRDVDLDAIKGSASLIAFRNRTFRFVFEFARSTQQSA